MLHRGHMDRKPPLRLRVPCGFVTGSPLPHRLEAGQAEYWCLSVAQLVDYGRAITCEFEVMLDNGSMLRAEPFSFSTNEAESLKTQIMSMMTKSPEATDGRSRSVAEQ